MRSRSSLSTTQGIRRPAFRQVTLSKATFRSPQNEISNLTALVSNLQACIDQISRSTYNQQSTDLKVYRYMQDVGWHFPYQMIAATHDSGIPEPRTINRLQSPPTSPSTVEVSSLEVVQSQLWRAMRIKNVWSSWDSQITTLCTGGTTALAMSLLSNSVTYHQMAAWSFKRAVKELRILIPMSEAPVPSPSEACV
jgi:hypothetical protein